MKKIFLLLIALCVVFCSVSSVFASEVTEPISNQILGSWVFHESLPRSSTSFPSELHFKFTVLSSGKQYFRIAFNNGDRVFMQYFVDGTYNTVYDSGAGYWQDPSYRKIQIDSIPSDSVEAAALLTFLNQYADKIVPNDFLDNATSFLPSYLSWVGVILSALFTPSGSLSQLGLVIAAGFIIFFVFLAFKAFRKLTPGV